MRQSVELGADQRRRLLGASGGWELSRADTPMLGCLGAFTQLEGLLRGWS